MTFVSVVLPVMNEVENVRRIYEALVPILLNNSSRFEVIFVVDPSSDGTADLVNEIVKDDGRVKGIFLADRAGQTEAIRAGYESALGDLVITMDADFQDPPQLIPAMIASWKSGIMIVNTARSSRKSDTFFYRSFIGFGYRVLTWLTSGRVKNHVGDFRLVDRKVVPLLLQYQDPHPFWRGIAAMGGIESQTLEFDRPPRTAGSTKYSYRIGSPLIALRGLASFSTKPLQFLQTLGVLALFLSGIVLVIIVSLQVLNPTFERGIPSIIALISVFFAIQFASTAIVATYLLVIVEQTRRRPNYILKPSDTENS